MTTVAELLEDFSIEITVKDKDVNALLDAAELIPAGTRVNITALANEDLELRAAAAAAVHRAGFVAVPHISARRLASEEELERCLSALEANGDSANIFVIAGDPPKPVGPYGDALSLIRAAPLSRYGVRTISIAGYPEGHPHIPDEALWSALQHKADELLRQGNAGEIVTQFGFDPAAAISWIERVRGLGIQLPIRVGVPGPAGVKRLLTYAARFGVSTTAGIARKYGLSLTNLLITAGPDKFISELAKGLDPSIHGVVRLHFYTFGGPRATAEWAQHAIEKSTRTDN